MKTIGILGGMGPEATADLYLKIIRIFQQKYGAKYDKDFPPFFIYSCPIPEMVEEIENENLVIKRLTEGVKKLESSGANFIVIACNTVQIYLPQLRKAVNIPVLSTPEETIKEIRKENYQKVGLLATEATLNRQLFDCSCQKFNIQLINQEKPQVLTKIIMNILAGQRLEESKQQLKDMITCLIFRGAEAVILGCTDLPLLIKQEDYQIKLFDTTQILAQAAVRECQQNIYKPKNNPNIQNGTSNC